MHGVMAATIACMLSLLVGGALSCTDCIIINSTVGDNNASCFQTRTASTTPCKTLAFVLSHSNASLTNTEVVLEGDHWINQTLTVSDVDRLTIRSSGNNSSTINCRPPSTITDIGSGLVFKSVSKLIVINIKFEGCGTLQLSTPVRNGVNVKYRSAVYIINSTDIHFSEASFHKNVGRGLSLHDVGGFVEIKNSVFSENKVPEEEVMAPFGGGGIYIEFTHCTPGHIYCNQTENNHNKRNSYVIEDCLFERNRATNNEVKAQLHIIQFSNLTGSDGNNAGQGGGIHITMKGTSFQNNITIHKCLFYNNSAQYGGGIDAVLQDNSRENIINITACTFKNNLALERTGGGINLGYISGLRVARNIIVVQDSHFFNNSAGRGGGVAFFSSRVKTTDTGNRLEFIDCKWFGNSASIGAALSLRPTAGSSLFDGVAPTPLLCRCFFSDNRVINTAAFLQTGRDGLTQHVLESGVLHLESIEVKFNDSVSFIGSTGSAIVATSSKINVLQGTKARFVNNRATYGGAMALLGFSILELAPNSQIMFDSNHASQLGGALYATSPHQTEFIFSHKCFISYSTYAHPNEWNTSLTFTNNTASYGYAIFTDSLLPCAKNVFDIETDVNAALKWTPFMYTEDIVQYTIATSPANITFTLPPEIAPGESIDINIISVDDLNHTIHTSYQVFLESAMGRADTNPFISDDDYLVISGKPGTLFNLTLRTQNTRHVSLTKNGRLENCPLGFTLQNDVCACSAMTADHFVGVEVCDMSQFQAYLLFGYWAGCTDGEKIVTGLCTVGYCNYESQSILLPKHCSDLDNSVCIPQRKGQICGECKEGYSVYYHSDNFKCGKCEYGAAGTLIYLVAEVIPLIFLFAGIMVTKLKMTSGLMQSFLLFAQTTSLINRVPSVTPLHQTVSTFTRIHSFLLGFLSLEFFKLDEFSFCLWSGATALDNLAARYVTTFCAFLLISLYLLMAKHFSPNAKRVMIILCKHVGNLVKSFKNSVVHGVSTFFILSYTQYTITSFQILSRITLHGKGGETHGSFLYVQGNVEYFGVDHLPYAIPAVLVLLFLSLPPPLLLISYPLLWRIKAKFRRNVETDNDKTLWPIRKLLPLIDSFQGVFRDNCRMFAGLIFLWRAIIIAIYILSTDLQSYFLLTEIALLSFFTIHAVARPYKRRLYNMIDIVMLANMAVINALSWYISVSSGTSKAKDAATAVKLLLMYLPLVFLVAVIILLFLRKCGFVPEHVQFPNIEEDDSRTADSLMLSKTLRTISTKERQDTCADEDLFTRAAQPNNPPLILTGSEAGFELQSKENTACSTTVN